MSGNMRPVVYKGITFNKYLIDESGMIYNKITGRMIKPWDDMRGYLVVELMSDNNIAIKVKNHLASAHTWIGPQEPGMIVNHINGNKHDPSRDNLEYISQRENVAHAQQLIKNKEYISEEKYNTIINDSKTMSLIDVARKNSLNTWIVRDILRGKTYNHYRR